jgi:amino acid transporter
MSELKRELGLCYATLFGVGLILGAATYVLIGRTAGIVGGAVWMNVAFSALIAVATAFSYAELSSIFTTAASMYTCAAEASPNSRLIAFMAAWMPFFGGVTGAPPSGWSSPATSRGSSGWVSREQCPSL